MKTIESMVENALKRKGYVTKMNRYHNENLLEMVELYAEEVGNIASEEELSQIFDERVADSVIKQYGENDIVAINEAFNNWTDMLCKDGEIHPEQYNNYCYIGKHSQDLYTSFESESL